MATGEAAGKTSVTEANSRTATGEVTIRKCEALEEMQACFALQKEVWKFADADLIPVRMFVVASKIGGQVIGAFDETDDANELVGFALAIPGMRNGYCYLHSQMLAVRQQYRNGGLGRRGCFGRQVHETGGPSFDVDVLKPSTYPRHFMLLPSVFFNKPCYVC